THFGETPKWESCNSCDVCGSAPGWVTITESRSAVRQVFTRKAAPAPPCESEVDSELREYLREWRRLTAKERGMPAFVILHDTTLEEICRIMPSSIAQLRTVSGIGERKADMFGQGILTAIRHFSEGARASAAPQKRTAPALETLQLISQGKTLLEIAET